MKIQTISDVETLLDGTPTAQELHACWSERHPITPVGQRKAHYGASDSLAIPWLEDASLAQKFVHHALRVEEFLLVVDAAREILCSWQTANESDRTAFVHIRVDYAIALTRLGCPSEARLVLEPCVDPAFHPELGRKLKAGILLQLGHILHDEWHYADAKASQQAIAQDALRFYQQALALTPDHLEALVFNASAAFLMQDESTTFRKYAQATARDILKRTADLEESEGSRLSTTWARATAHAILGQLPEALLSYKALQAMNGVTTAYLADARFHAKFLAEAQGQPKDFFNTAFPRLQLVVFAGHMPDLPGARARLPLSAIPAAREAVRKQLEQMEARVGLVSASAGADLLFTEALHESGGTFHLVLPWSQEEFRRTSVLPYEPLGEPLWEQQFDRAVRNAATVREIGQVYEPGSDAGWQFMMEVTAGIALRTARSLRLDIQPLVLWDGNLGAGAGGTDSFRDFWTRKLAVAPIVIPVPQISASSGPQPTEGKLPGCERSILHQEVKSMLFADIVGYSKLTEKAIPEFIGTFLERAARLIASSKHAPCNVNTWGDAIYAVFDFARDAGLFALELARMVQDGEKDWLDKGLYWESRSPEGETTKHPLNIRIGLHTGPVVMHYDPVVRRLGFTGAHVNRAARIEPVAEPGQVFASEEFAAMLELSSAIQQRISSEEEVSSALGFACEYAGSMQLAKGYPGRHRIYRVVPRRVFALERLAKAVHDRYRAASTNRGLTPDASTASLRPWEDLSEDLRESSRAQVVDIDNKLRLIGFVLAPGYGLPPSAIVITDAQLETMAIREHDRWMEERRRQGWTYAAKRDNARKLHPLLIPWDQLAEPEREKDRDTVRNLSALVEEAGFRLQRIN